MAELDHGAKLALRIDPQGVIGLGLPGTIVFGALSSEAVSAQRTVDAAFEALFEDGSRGILHVEFEAQPTSTSGARAARAACALHIATERRVRVVVLYLHPSVDGRRPPDRYALPIGEQPVLFAFQARPLWEVDPEPVLAGSITGLLPFVPLMCGATIEHVRRAAQRILALDLPAAARADLAVAALFLARLHFQPERLAGIIPREVLMKSPAYQDLLDEACDRQRKVLLRMLLARFGAVPTGVDDRLRVADPDVVDRVTLAFAERDDSAVLAAVRALGLQD